MSETKTGATPPPTREQVLEELNKMNGHAVLTKEFAEQVCKAFNVPFTKTLYRRQAGSFNATTGRRGVWGVCDLSLLYDIARQLGINADNQYMGRGFQAQHVIELLAKARPTSGRSDF